MDDGTLYGWGVNSSNELGDGGTFNVRTPKVIQNIPTVKQFIFNGYTGLALGTDGCVYSWGKNVFGEAGTGNSYRKSYASKITVLGNDIEEIYDGYNSMYAIDSDGTAYGWGKNSDLQIATRGISLCAPTVIQGIDNVQGIQKSGNLVLAFNEDNIIYSWGDNSYGQAGDGTLLDVSTPFAVYDSVSKTIEGTGNVQSTVPVIGTINALEVSVTHPLNISYVINPNIEESFVCSNISITNNSKVPVKITIESFVSSEGSIFEDVMPYSMDWDTLSSADTKRYIALGIDYPDISQWINFQSEFPLYAAEIDNDYLGVLSSGSIGTLSLSCSHGLAFEGSFEAEHELIFIVSIY